MPDGPEQEARDKIFLSQLGKEVQGPFPNRWTCPIIQPWIFGYDAYGEVEAAVRAQPFPDTNSHIPTPPPSKLKQPSFIDRIAKMFKLVTTRLS